MRRIRLKAISAERRAEMAMYYKLQAEFLAKPENRDCAICKARRAAGERVRLRKATEVHHWAGRIGRLLWFVPYFMPSCRSCRSYPHDNPARGRRLGILAPAPQWETWPPKIGLK